MIVRGQPEAISGEPTARIVEGVQINFEYLFSDIAKLDTLLGAALVPVAGAVVYSASAALALTAVGTTNDVLRSGGTTAPTWSTPAALTKVDDTNVTLTLGGTPTTALLAAASITAGWTGTLAAARLNANVVQAVANDTNITGSISAQNLTLGWTGTLAAARLNANVVQSVVNDTNVTGSIATQGLTLGWTGTLAPGRGGTGLATFGAANALLVSLSSSSLAALASVVSAMLTTDGSGVPTWTTTLPAGMLPANVLTE